MPGRKSEMQANIYPLDNPVNKIVEVSGSKSYTNRALIIATLAKGVSTLTNCSDSDDSLLMTKLLKKLGVKIISEGNEIKVYGTDGKFNGFNGTINVRDAGTVMRFFIALCCIIPGEIILKGTKRMHQRPVKGLVDTLIQLGADISYMEEDGFPPVKIKGGKVRGGKVKMDASQSSQFVSALLMIAPALSSGLDITIQGEMVSGPYIDMTLNVMRNFGIAVKLERHHQYIVNGKQGYNAGQYYIEADASGSTYFLGIAAITQSTVRVSNLSPLSLQGDVRFTDLLLKMGCNVKIDSDRNYMEVTGVKELKPIEADMKDMPDAAPALAVVTSFAKGTSIIRGLKNLELKESKRLSVLQEEMTKMGIRCHSDGEQITIEGGNPKGAFIHTHNDHRIAMAFAMAGTRVDGFQIESPKVVKKSFPNFWDRLREIGTKVEIEKRTPNIVLIGFMGAGKTTVGKLLAKKLQLGILETDTEIIKHSRYKSVNEIFNKKGEAFFRELEHEVILSFAEKSNHIISCGGGVINNPANIKALKKNGKIIYLSAYFETIVKRLHGQHSRPLFQNKENAKKLCLQRLPLYKNYADEVIKTDNLTPEEVAESIVKLIVSNAR